jgi:20S proteasome alpha/beta subunit
MSELCQTAQALSRTISYPLKHVLRLPRRELPYFPNPDRERVKPREHMTIAACFKFDGGVLFCADTKITSDIKTNESKIFDKVYEGGYCVSVFVLTGGIPFAKSVIAKCENRISKLDHLQVTFGDIQEELQGVLSDFYQSHIYPHPDRPAIDFGLLIGVWLRGETRMFSTYDATVNVVREYECLGAGAYLAKYWIKQFLASQKRWEDQTRPLEDIALISTFALKSVMDYDESCGGEAQFLVMKENGEIEFEIDTPIRLYRADEFPTQIFTQMWRLLRSLARSGEEPDTDMMPWEFESEVKRIVSQRSDWIRTLTTALKGTKKGRTKKQKPEGG